MSDNPAPELSYEQAREQLIAVVRDLESGNLPLSASMELWSRGEKLAAICQQWLDGARETIRRAQAGGAERAGGAEGAGGAGGAANAD